MKNEVPTTIRIAETIIEADGIKSIFLPLDLQARPGQFAMIWLPGVDAKPVGIAYQERGLLGFTVSAIGGWSSQVSDLKVGDYLGVLGPYGNGFNLRGRRVVLVGGGYGTASLMLLAEQAVRQGLQATVIVGARSQNKVIYQERLAKLALEVIYTTDDGSFGRAGTNVEVLADILDGETVDEVYACGPELMELRLAELCVARKVPAQISVERHMKCGFGVCGACCIDSSGKRVCVEGPVFSAAEVLTISEFGRYHRDSSATKHYF